MNLFQVSFGYFPSGIDSCLVAADSVEEVEEIISERYNADYDKTWKRVESNPVYDYTDDIYTYTVKEVAMKKGVLHTATSCC